MSQKLVVTIAISSPETVPLCTPPRMYRIVHTWRGFNVYPKAARLINRRQNTMSPDAFDVKGQAFFGFDPQPIDSHADQSPVT